MPDEKKLDEASTYKQRLERAEKEVGIAKMEAAQAEWRHTDVAFAVEREGQQYAALQKNPDYQRFAREFYAVAVEYQERSGLPMREALRALFTPVSKENDGAVQYSALMGHCTACGRTYSPGHDVNACIRRLENEYREHIRLENELENYRMRQPSVVAKDDPRATGGNLSAAQAGAIAQNIAAKGAPIMKRAEVGDVLGDLAMQAAKAKMHPDDRATGIHTVRNADGSPRPRPCPVDGCPGGERHSGGTRLEAAHLPGCGLDKDHGGKCGPDPRLGQQVIKTVTSGMAWDPSGNPDQKTVTTISDVPPTQAQLLDAEWNAALEKVATNLDAAARIAMPGSDIYRERVNTAREVRSLKRDA